jgi:hypothetical protein
MRLCVLAATEVTHGESDGEPTVPAPGPSLPAETARKIPARRALRKAIAFGSVHGSRDAPPIEKLITSTPSSVAWLIPATVAEGGHVPRTGVVTQPL